MVISVTKFLQIFRCSKERTLVSVGLSCAFVLMSFFGIETSLFANPTGAQVVHGDVSIVEEGNKTTIQASDSSIINWESFSIAPHELTEFVQPNCDSTVLNRVTNDQLSELMGQLKGNGNVFLVNPGGIIVGNDAVIDTGAFIASTLDVANEQFIANGEMLFEGDSKASIVNLGTIRSLDGEVLLLGYQVENQGTIEVGSGLAALVVGSEILLKPNSLDRVYVKLAVPEEDFAKRLQDDLGRGYTIFSKAINNSGIINATSVVTEGGRILLRAENAKVEVAGTLAAEGGKVHVFGEQVELAPSALIDVNSHTNAGEVLIGGDYKGQNAERFYPSKRTTVQPGATINADSTFYGDGGKVIIWSDELTEYAGMITARGGKESGNGGFGEVSGKVDLSFRGTADLSSPMGKNGTFLVDPKNITIGSTGTSLTGNQLFADSPSSDFTFSVLSLDGLLLSQDVTLQANTDITIATSVGINAFGSNSLTLAAGRSVILQESASIEVLNGNLTITFNDENAISAQRDAGTAAFTMTDTSSIYSNNGNINIATGNFGGSYNGELGVANAIIESQGSGSVTVSGKLNIDVTGLNNVEFSFDLVITDDSTITAPGSFVNLGKIDGFAPNPASLTIDIGSGTLECEVAIGGTTPLQAFVVADGQTPITLHNNITTSGNHIYLGNGAVTLASDVTLTATVSEIELQTLDGRYGITFATPYQVNGGVGQTTPLTTISVGSGAYGSFGGDVTTTGAIDLGTDNGEISQVDITLKTTGNTTYSSNGANITIGGELEAPNLVLIAGTGEVSLPLSTSVSQQSFITSLTISSASKVNFSGRLNVTNAISFSSAVELIGDTYITTTNAAITFNDSVNGDGVNARGLTLNSGTGVITFASSLGSTNQLGSLTLTRTSSLNLGVPVTSLGSVNFGNGPTVLTEDVSITLTGGTATFPSTINGDGVALRSLTVNNASGNIEFSGVVGGSVPLGQMVIDGSTNVLGADITTAGNIIFGSPVSLSSDVLITTSNNDVSFQFTVDGAHGLSISTGTGGIFFVGMVGSSTPLASLTLTRTSDFTIQNNITTTGAIDFGIGAVTLGNSVSITTSGGNISFQRSLDGDGVLGRGLYIVAGSGTVNFFRFVGATHPLQTLTVASPTVTELFRDVSTVGAMNFGGTVNVNQDLTLTTQNGSVTFGGAVNGRNKLTVNSGTGNITVSGAIGNTAPLASLTLIHSSGLDLGGNITTTGAVDLGEGDITLCADITITTSNANVTFGSAIDGDGVSDRAITVNAGTGTISHVDHVGNTTPPASFIIPGASPISLAGNITTTGVVNLGTGQVSLGNGTRTITTSNADVTFGGKVDGGEALIVTCGTGTVSVGAHLGSSTPLTSFTVTDASPVQLGASITSTGAINLNTGSKTMTGDSTLTTTNSLITLGNTVNGAYALGLNSGTAAITISYEIGGTTPLSSVTLTGGTINLGANINTSGSTQTYNSPVVLTSDRTITDSGTGIIFNDTVSGNYNLTLLATNSAGIVTGNGAIDLTASGSNGGALSVVSGGSATFVDITTSGGTTTGVNGFNGGDVSIVSSNGYVTVGTVTTSGSNPGSGTGGNGGNITLSPSASFEVGTIGVPNARIPAGRVILNGNLVADKGTGGTRGAISVASAGRSESMSVATIVSSQTGNSVTITGDTFTVGDYEVISVLGNLTIDMDTSMTLGDTICVNDMTLSATTINVRTRDLIQLVSSDGTLYDSPNAHVFAGETLSTTGTKAVIGSAAAPTYQSLGLDPSYFQGILVYNGYVLNWDNFTPLTAEQLQESVTLGALLNSEMSFDLRHYDTLIWRPFVHVLQELKNYNTLANPNESVSDNANQHYPVTART